MNEILDKLKPEFIKELDKHCVLFMTIGSRSSESPKWLQYRGVEEHLPMKYTKEGNVERISWGEDEEPYMVFKSSQCGIGFSISITDKLSEEEISMVRHSFYLVYPYFKSLKYKHIRENYPTITEGGTQ